jgi:dipeptidyl aminopeptidase/acylaminoacyl peptidase
MRALSFFASLAIVAGGIPATAQAQTSAVPAKIATGDFAALPLLRRPLLSPDGKRIVARSTVDGKTSLVILNADGANAAGKKISIGETEVAGLRWAGNQRLLLTVKSVKELPGRNEYAFLRLIAIDTATGTSRLVDHKSRGLYGGDVLYTDPTGAWALVASQDYADTWPSVKRIDLSTGDGTVVEKAKTGVWDWYADDKGVVRAGIAYEGRRWTVWHRDKPEEKLRAIHGQFPKDEDSAVDRFIFRGDKSWIVTNERTGRFGLYKYDLKSGTVGETIFEHAQVDLEDLLYNPITGDISAIIYHDDRQRIHWLDPKMKALQAKLDRALPSSVNLTTGWSEDEKRVLVWSGGAADPGRYFLLNRTTAKMHPVVDPYPRIDPAQLSQVKAVRYQARDGLSLPAYLTLPRGRESRNLPLIVLPHGGPFARDEWDYDALVQFLANRGYAVLQPQFRGSTGYGKDFVTKGYGEIGKKMQDDLDDGVDWLIKSGQVDPKRVCIVGMSYGGYAALWGVSRNPERYRCAASMAGVSDLRAQLRYDRGLFSATRYFREWRSQIGGEGKIDLATVSPISFADRLKVPVFIAHGEADKTVPAKQSREMIEALTKAGANVTSAFYKNSGHGFDSSADYEDWLRRLEAFLEKHNPA